MVDIPGPTVRNWVVYETSGERYWIYRTPRERSREVAVQAGDLLFLSGVVPFRDGKLALPGKLGTDLTVEQGYEAARIALLNALAIVRKELGTLDRVKKVVRMVGHVASADGFVQQPAVVNGASDLLVKIFDEAGRHARVAVGAAGGVIALGLAVAMLVSGFLVIRRIVDAPPWGAS